MRRQNADRVGSPSGDEVGPGPTAAFSVSEFCLWAGVGRTTVYGEIAAGRLNARKLGRRTIILRSDAERWLADLPLARSP